MLRVSAGPAFLGILVALTAGCGGDDVTAPRRAASLNVVSGNGQTAEINTELPQPLVVRVTDAQGHPVEGQIVNFRVTQGGGSVFAGAGLTNASGIVQDRWTLGPYPGEQVVEARAVDNETGSPLVFATFTATATGGEEPPPPPPPPPSFGRAKVLSGANQRALVGTRLPEPIVFLILDQNEHPFPHFTFTLFSLQCIWSSGFFCPDIGGDNQLVNPSLTTGADGTATFTGWTLGITSGRKCLDAVPGTTIPQPYYPASGVVCAEALPGPVTQLFKISGDGQTARAGATIDVDVQVEDQYGNRVNGVPVTFVPSAGGSVSPAVDTTRYIPGSFDGRAVTRWTITTGPNTLTATVAGLSVTFTATGT